MTSAESRDLSIMVARFMGARCPVDQSRVDAGTGGRPALWDALATEIGLVGLQVEERHGGQGAGVAELGAAVLETARAGWAGPLVATAGVAVHLLTSVDPDDSTGLLAAIAAGELVVVVAVHEQARGEDLAAEATTAHDGEAVTVTGRKVFVDAGTQADVLLVVARDLEGAGDPVLVRVETSAPGVGISAMSAVDVGRGLAEVDLDGAPGQVVARGDGLLDAVMDAWLVGGVLTSADGVGLATRAMDLSREYAVTREQFGRPIAAFQSVKHKLVDMYVDLQTAISAVERALDEIDAGAPGWRTSASMATARSSDAVMHVVREAVQVHGGIGFTWEHELSYHFRRATTLRAVYGTPATHRRLVAGSWGLS